MADSRQDTQSEFLRLLLRHERRIYAYIRTLVHNAADAEDVLQETSTVLWKKFEHYRRDSDFTAWALNVAWREVHAYRRRQHRDRLQFDDHLVETLAEAAGQQCDRFSDLQGALDHCVGQLHKDARSLLLRRYEPGASVEGLARDMDRPIQTVYSMLKRIRRTVFDCIQRTLAAGEAK